MNDFFGQFKRIRYYVFAGVLAYGLFLWCSLKGVKILGDDNETEETHTQNSYGRRVGSHGYYHK